MVVLCGVFGKEREKQLEMCSYLLMYWYLSSTNGPVAKPPSSLYERILQINAQ